MINHSNTTGQPDSKNPQRRLYQLMGQLMRFTLVGGLAALLHYVVALQCSQWLDIAWANVVAFLVAFWISFFGHFYFSFQQGQRPNLAVLIKFCAVAISGFAINQAVLLLQVQLTDWPLRFMLALAIVVSAGSTFVLSRVLVFKDRPHAD